jgi:RIO kinase 1
MSSSDEYDYIAYEYDFTSLQGTKYQELDIKYSKKINDNLIKHPSELPSSIISSIKLIEKKNDENRIRIKDKGDRATVELVLDRRTRIVLYKLISSERISEIFGCISAGKEANVYYAVDKTDKEFAIKVYKTSILIFKDRHRYVEGEFRFRHGYSRHNPRQMVAMWAEKEMRNLKRLQVAGIPCPDPYFVKQNVLLMSFIGHSSKAASRLKDVNFGNRSSEFYVETVKIMRDMYQKCKLVHADFSEYNLLYYNDQVYVIDVSQSVEHDHPQALYFLRRDCSNINDFYCRCGAQVLTVQGLFGFITDLNEMNDEERWSKALSTEEINDEVFKEIYIPRTLHEIDDAPQDTRVFCDLTGINPNDENESEDNSDASDTSSNKDNEEKIIKKQHGDVIYQGLSKQERKNKVKEDKKEKRKIKVPKHIKKQKIKKFKHT